METEKRHFKEDKVHDHHAILPTGQCWHNLSREELNILKLINYRLIETGLSSYKEENKTFYLAESTEKQNNKNIYYQRKSLKSGLEIFSKL